MICTTYTFVDYAQIDIVKGMRKTKEPTPRRIQKIMRKMAKNRKNEFIPYTVSLKEWCVSHEVPNHFDWIRNLILNELEKYEELGDYIFLDEGLYDIHLDHNGIFIFSHILQDFFGIEQVLAMYRLLSNKNQVSRMLFEISEYPRTCDNEESEKVLYTIQQIVDMIHTE